MQPSKALVITIILLWASFSNAADTAKDPFAIDLSPDPTALEKANKPDSSDHFQPLSAISTVVQNLNPDISFIGDFIAGNSAALYQVDDSIRRPIYLREIEIDGAGYVSPYAKALFVVSFGEGGDMDVEEANMNFFNLPASLTLKLGKMLVDTDTLNPLHQHAIPFVERPLILHHTFGKEGLKTVGANLSWLVPNPWDHYILFSGTYGVNTGDELNSGALFGGNNKSMLTNLHGSTSWDLGEKTYLNVNASGVFAPMPDGSLTQVYVTDFLLRYAPDPYAFAITFLNGFIWNRGDPFHSGASTTKGFYNYLGWQFSSRWRVGARYDQTFFPSDNSYFPGNEREYTGIITFYPTETNYLRFQYARHQAPDALAFEEKIWLQLNFTIGPHQQHTAL
jgi:hypothetical protein